MDVVWGETAGVDGQLLLLCPILFILQVLFNDYYIFNESVDNIHSVCFFVLSNS